MRTALHSAIVVAILALTATALVPGAGAQTDAQTGLRFDIGLTYAQGIYDIRDKLEQNFPFSDNVIIPIALELGGHYEFNSGIGVGVEAGPVAFLDVEDPLGGGVVNVVAPVGAYARYTFLRDRDIAPYVKAGVRYNFVSGDNLQSGSPGAYGAVGVEFWHTRACGAAIELGYDSSTVKVLAGPLGGEKTATYGGFLAGLKFTF